MDNQSDKANCCDCLFAELKHPASVIASTCHLFVLGEARFEIISGLVILDSRRKGDGSIPMGESPSMRNDCNVVPVPGQ